jgi:hypothetical protein
MSAVIKLHVWDNNKKLQQYTFYNGAQLSQHTKHTKMCSAKSSVVEDVRVMGPGLTCTFTSDTSNSRVTLFLQTLTGKIQKKFQQT